MKGFFIINPKNSNIILSKQYNHKESLSAIEKLQNLICYKKLDLTKSPFIMINNNTVIISELSNLFYVSIYSNSECIVTEALNIHEIIYKALKSNSYPNQPTTEFIKENLINILLMIDIFLVDGKPIIDEIPVLSSLIQGYEFGDKFTENYIGKPRDYDISTLENYLKESMLNDNNKHYFNPYAKKISGHTGGKEKILIDYIDEVSSGLISATSSSNNNIFHDITITSKLAINSIISNRVDVGITMNFPYKIKSDNLYFSPEVKTDKQDFQRGKYMEISPKYGENDICKWVPCLYSSSELDEDNEKFFENYNNNSASNFSLSSSVRLPFKLNIVAHRTDLKNE